jgi:hypothetical protein
VAGHRPTPLLEDIVRKRGLRPLKNSKQDRVSMAEHDAVDVILDAALTFEEQFLVCSWAARLLHVLGLVVECKDGEVAGCRRPARQANGRRNGPARNRAVKVRGASVSGASFSWRDQSRAQKRSACLRKWGTIAKSKAPRDR